MSFWQEFAGTDWKLIARRLALALIALFMMAGTGMAQAASYTGVAYSVHDGDTVTILTNTGKVHCRLANIDAPELAFPGRWTDQPYGWEAHAALETMIQGQTVYIVDQGTDRYHRHICDITAMIDERPVRISEEMVREGMAWDYQRYDIDPRIPFLQADAKAAHRGLWADPNAIAPWEWRHGHP